MTEYLTVKMCREILEATKLYNRFVTKKDYDCVSLEEGRDGSILWGAIEFQQYSSEVGGFQDSVEYLDYFLKTERGENQEGTFHIYWLDQKAADPCILPEHLEREWPLPTFDHWNEYKTRYRVTLKASDIFEAEKKFQKLVEKGSLSANQVKTLKAHKYNRRKGPMGIWERVLEEMKLT